MGLNGWVLNSSQGVFIETEGEEEVLKRFLLRIEKDKPARSVIQSLESSYLDPVGFETFEVKESKESGKKTAFILPDIATCSDCLRDIFDPANRRYRYPFTNCTNCGPRFTIIEALPYDRPNTTMRHFPMCDACRAEYEDPGDRRFHAQPNACPVCGPRLELRDRTGESVSTRGDALGGAARAMVQGHVVAVKGLGGFHLMVDARDPDAVARLRERKHRDEKPFALMFPSLSEIRVHAETSDLEERLLLSPESPIVLLRRRVGDTGIAPGVAPNNPYLGVMLPYTPLHHLLMAEVGFPVVATSGNLSDEPIVTDERDAQERLHGIADFFLVHNRPIARHADDSIVRVMMGRELVTRRARGYAPLPIPLREDAPAILAVGPHLKNTVAFSLGNQVFISQHVGDLETAQAYDTFKKVIASFSRLYELRPRIVACDLHPDYLSTRFAGDAVLHPVRVQHHHAHILSVMAENEIDGSVLGVSWDGTGYGTDGTIWGGEFLRVGRSSCERVGHLRTFRLPGGEKAVREPRRSAIGLLYEMHGAALFERRDLPPLRTFEAEDAGVLGKMLEKNVHSPVTSSAGRLFDAVASIVGICQKMRFEGQAAMYLEYALEAYRTEASYPFEIREDGGARVLDWEPMIRGILQDADREVPAGEISAKFHNTLVEFIVEMARRAGEERVALSGGCFQNRALTERCVQRLRAEGFRPYWHQRVPPNDGGIALGQVVAALQQQGDRTTR